VPWTAGSAAAALERPCESRVEKGCVGVTRFDPVPHLRGVTFAEFAAARLPGLLRYAVVLTGDRDLAQDVVQEVLARAQVRWNKIEKSDSPDAYVRRMVLNEYLSWRRTWTARNVRAVGERLIDLSDRRGQSRDYAQDVVETDELWNRLAALPRKQRAVLVLRYYEQVDDDEIAYLLGCAAVTVRSNASKALKSLRLQSERQYTTVAGDV
jgi:RNA polymerase sigma-70 factor (sigma-E family)